MTSYAYLTTNAIHARWRLPS